MHSKTAWTLFPSFLVVVFFLFHFFPTEIGHPPFDDDALHVAKDSGDSCETLGTPQRSDLIPLPSEAYTRDRVLNTTNYVMGSLALSSTTSLLLALPRRFSSRIDQATGVYQSAGNSGDTFARARAADPSNGIFIDVGGWVGDSSFTSAICGIDTYVFEPVRYNTNLMHMSLLANDCVVSKHLCIVNTMVGDTDGMASIFVTADRADNAAQTKAQAQKNVGATMRDFTQTISVVRLDSFFPSGTKVQNLKIDVQGNEFKVLTGAKRILQENRGRLKLRFEADDGLLKLANASAKEIIVFMQNLGYTIVKKGENIDMS
ncbi:MAG: S-adenosyl-L-methionine-dependent methyltransferase [Monoraphidium minutum]|nr:MAG: S-adenosyl-L-methionine-dependent methyltransferase [Monoraphidium minutum]